MIQWSPDTGPDAWYDYGKNRIYGFSLTHISGAGCPLYGDIPVLPWTGDLTVSPHQNRELYTQPFDHTHETAHPGYYAVTLANGIEVEITVTDTRGIAQFRFPTGIARPSPHQRRRQCQLHSRRQGTHRHRPQQ